MTKLILRLSHSKHLHRCFSVWPQCSLVVVFSWLLPPFLIRYSLLLRFNFPRSLLLAATSLVPHAQHSRFSGVSLHEVAYEPFVGGALVQAGPVPDVSDAQR